MKTINTNITIDASPQEVWDALIDFESHERWNPFFAQVIGTPSVGEKLSITARKPDGSGGMSFTPTVLEVEPAATLRWKGKLLIKGIFDGEHFFKLTAQPDGRTRLEHGENFSGVLIPFMGKMLAETERGFNDFNQALADEVAARRGAHCSA